VRVVFDTNIFVSALALPGGTADRAIRRIIEGRDHLVESRPIINELLDVLARKFRRDTEDLARAAVFVADLGELVESRRRLRVLKDDADNRILECAVAGGASYRNRGSSDARVAKVSRHSNPGVAQLCGGLSVRAAVLIRFERKSKSPYALGSRQYE
jgi:uncharacterized protein